MNQDFAVFSSIKLSAAKKEPLYVQLYTGLHQLIQAGQLSPGYALPPVRKFAAWLGINPGTVVNAYHELEKNGFLFSRRGSGSFVAEPPESIDQEPVESIDDMDDSLPDPELPDSSFATAINMSSISLNPDIVSIKQFRELILKVLDRDQARAFGYQESQGFLPLRESIADYLAASGVHTDAERLQIIS